MTAAPGCRPTSSEGPSVRPRNAPTPTTLKKLLETADIDNDSGFSRPVTVSVQLTDPNTARSSKDRLRVCQSVASP